jgi:hypothetical protein
VELDVNGEVPLNGALGRLIRSAGWGFHSRSVDPHRGRLHIRKVTFRDYMADPTIRGPTGGAARGPRGEARATSPVDLP